MVQTISNNLMILTSQGKLCKVIKFLIQFICQSLIIDSKQAFGIKIVKTPQIVQIIHNASFDCLFIDLEHSTLSLEDMSQFCIIGIQLGITPFVRVPYQCGDGFVQRVLDGGALGVIFPHIHNRSMPSIIFNKAININ